jgi:tRNA-specific 2-thiouridylase
MEKVVIGMSGGVDSSVAAYLLKEQGYEVIGLFMRNWDTSINNDFLGNPYLDNDICTQEEDYNDALRVCNQLNIPLHRVDFVKEYWDNVFSYFLEELKKGRTPNPDIMCNKYIKFDSFVKEAIKLGADYIATGHYARIVNNKLLKGSDDNKDQTYFLSQLSKKQLEKVLFPIGHLPKQEVREIALKLNLDTAEKKDSTGICFIGERNFKEFLSNYLPHQPGDIVNIETNEVMGRHVGLMYYTIGQRRGIEIGGSTDKIYAVGKSMKDNILYVAYGDNNEYLFSDSAIIESINWISDNKPTKCMAKFRYRQKDQPVELEYLDDDHIRVRYNNIKAVTPGQACVFYLGDECLGGGIIKEIYKDNKKIWYL